ncbi:C40 family peptidase [Streptomyces sp. NPDC048623]|uniref:C40 family peptidase n=1 Tax=Streptomyces sp. NPDC048623 TaxID=3155761 RepID=UPI00343D6239
MLLAIAAARSPRARRNALLLSLAAVGTVLAPVAIVSSAVSAFGSKATSMSGVSCVTGGLHLASSTGASYSLAPDQMANAETIVTTGRNMGIPVKGQVIAIATALQESNLKNINYGDRDSIGLFQQRPSQGWGTREQIMNPVYSSWKFYKGLQKVPGWERMAVTDAAQAVQRSGFPYAYAKHEPKAVGIVAGMTDGGIEQINSSGCTPVGAPASDDVAGYVRVALQQVGKPYVWGATGPDSFDCSGLIVYGWRQTGYQLKVRTSQQMYSVAVPIAEGQERSGDLIFTRMAPGGPEHVLIVVRPGVAVEAARTGIPVRVREYDPKKEPMKFGRLPTTQMEAISGPA